MPTKAAQQRIWCSQMLRLHLQYRSGRPRRLNANLEEIWSSGALFLTGVRIPPLTRLWFDCGGSEFHGKVIARTFSERLGYFVEMRFDPGNRWSEREFRPKHLFNPLLLLANRIFEATLRGVMYPQTNRRVS